MQKYIIYYITNFFSEIYIWRANWAERAHCVGSRKTRKKIQLEFKPKRKPQPVVFEYQIDFIRFRLMTKGLLKNLILKNLNWKRNEDLWSAILRNRHYKFRLKYHVFFSFRHKMVRNFHILCKSTFLLVHKWNQDASSRFL